MYKYYMKNMMTILWKPKPQVPLLPNRLAMYKEVTGSTM